MRLRLAAALLLLAALPGCSALSALGDAATPLDVYELRAPAEVAQAPRRALQVTVELPSTTGALETDRILIKPDALAAQYLPDARWGEEVPVMVQSLMLRTLQRTGAFAYVGRDPLGVSGDIALVTDVVDFQAEVAGEGAEIALTLRVEAVREDDVEILSSATFTGRARSPNTETPTLVRAFDTAAAALLGDVADWAVAALR